MKELSIEEKAKRFDEAIKKLRSLHDDYDTVSTLIDIKEELENIFPELKENNEDEKIKSDIQYAVRCAYGDQSEQTNKILAWLDKQGEQKTLCDKCRKEHPSHSCQDITELGRCAVEHEQKHVWSEEDEKMLNSFLYKLEVCEFLSKEDIWIKNKLKSLKDRVQPQNITYYNPYKEVVESIAEMCKHYDKASHNGLRDFYDNVKVKCKDAKEYDSLYHQNTWKPNDEQMEALDIAIRCGTQLGSWEEEALKSLKEQLKKLMEE